MGGDVAVSTGVSVVCPSVLAERAAAALELTLADPAEAFQQAHDVLERAGDDAVARSLAHETLGLVAKEQQRLDEAASHLHEAVTLAEAAGLTTRASQARISRCIVLVSRGETDAALREVERAEAVLDGTEGAQAQVRRGLVLQRLGRLDAALAVYERALPRLRAAGDGQWEARALTNRGVLHTYRRQYGAAERDLLRAERRYTDLGQTLAAAQVRHNLGFVAARRGDVPAALRSYDRAAEQFQQLGIVAWLAEADRCELLLSARLLSEADELATRAVDALARAGMESDLAEARLTLANVKLLLGQPATAQDIAEQARSAFVAQGRQPWAVLADHSLLHARWQNGPCTEELFVEARQVADDLAAAGWTTAAADSRLVAARVALDLGAVTAAEAELARSRGSRRRGPVELRAHAWYVEALLRLARGNRRGADAALRAGMRALERHRATLGATELRIHASGHVADLAALGVRLAVESGDAGRVLRWAERWRAGALALRPARPPDDEQLGDELVELRETVAGIGKAALAGKDTAALVRRQVALERSIQQRSRHARGRDDDAAASTSVDGLGEELGERVLVEMVRVDDELHAVVVADGRRHLRRLGSHRVVVCELERLQFALRRLTLAHRTPAALATARASAATSAERLDRALLVPVWGIVGDRPMVIVPTGALHAVPWATLPSCVGRPVSVAPSASLWRRAARQAPIRDDAGATVLVGCSSPPHATSEVQAIGGRYAGADMLVDTEATVDGVTAAFDGAVLAHVACHGRFRADNPLFSCLELADGPLTVAELERRRRAPRLLVLSACESGLSTVQPGDALMGLSATLFTLGTATLVASVAAVPDAATRTLMVAFHERLRRGQSPAVALAAVQAASGPDDADRLAAAGFVCFGAG